VTSEIYNLVELKSTATVVTTPTAAPEVVVAYDGTTAPMGLFLSLGAVGFAGLAPQPPPADAIDWTTPDPIRGTNHTVLPYRAASTGRFDGPLKDRERAVDAARLILERLAGPSLPPPPDAPPPPVAAVNATRDLSRPATASPAPGPSGSNGANGSNGNPVGPAPMTAAPTPAAAAAAPAPAEPTPPTSAADADASATSTFEIVADAVMVAELRAVITMYGEITEERPVTWTTEVRFRGSVEEKHHPALRFTVAVPTAKEEELRVALSGYRLRSLDVVGGRPTAGVTA
jgi:hypothetical protein